MWTASTSPRCLWAPLASLLMIVLTSSAAGQTGGRVWVELTAGMPAGTPPEIAFDDQNSTTSDSFFDVFVHGFWKEDVRDSAGNPYVKIELPDLSPHRISPFQLSPFVEGPAGIPMLPSVKGHVAVATSATDVRLGQTQLLDVRTFRNFGLVWPAVIPALDHEEGTPERFVRDEAIYGSRDPWPPVEGSDLLPVEPVLGSIRGAKFQVFPVKFNPSSRDLQVAAHARYHLVHPGSPVPSPPITKDRGRLAQKLFANWNAVFPNFQLDTFTFTGDFLFIYPDGFRDELLPLINQKKARGFSVTEMTTATTGATCDSIRLAIQGWYYSTPDHRDKYLLLVGEVGRIPLCRSPDSLTSDYPNGVASDDPYGSLALNLSKEIYHGRLSVDSEADCANQVAKILDYEDHPSLTAMHFDDVLLVANLENAPGKYVGAHEDVRTASYAVPPTFHTRYGHLAGNDNAAVISDIDGGMGLVAYRGHGSTTIWSNWNLPVEDFHNDQVNALANGGKTPVVLSFACTNANLNSGDCIAEKWMEKFPGGAVAHVGATTASYTTANHELDRKWFKAIYDEGLTTISHAMAWAENEMATKHPSSGSANAWMYLLLGDPDMQIRRANPITWAILTPAVIPSCPRGPCPPIDIQVLDHQGRPVEQVLVAAWKPAGPPANEPDSEAGHGGPPADEVFDNRYTDRDGRASIPRNPTTPGWVHYTVQDDDGNAVLDSIEVRDLTGVPPGAQTPRFAAIPNVTGGSTFFSFGRAFASPVRVLLYDVAGRLVRRLDVEAGLHGVTWDGTDGSGRRVSSGVYLARLSGPGLLQNARVVITR